MREKLIELIREGRYDAEAICNTNDDCQSCPITDPSGNCKYGCIADHLIANGVTIPVRCGECWAYNKPDCPMSGSPGKVSVSDFCSYGERKAE